MQRRRFLTALGTGPFILRGAGQTPSVAITLDDMNWQNVTDPAAVDECLLSTLSREKIRAFLFVVGQNADTPEGAQILKRWRSAGQTIGNHTYSHHGYTNLGFPEFSADVAKADALLFPRPEGPKWFRFPMLKEGDTAAKRDAMRGWLNAHNYRNGHVTIDASDWYYNQRLQARLKKDPAFDVDRFRRPYLAHIWDRAQYYEKLGRSLTGRSVPHTILLHYNMINSLFLPQICEQFRQNGWRLIDAAEAYRDSLFTRQPKTAPAGESLLWALAKESGRYESELRYPAEDDVYEKPLLDRLAL